MTTYQCVGGPLDGGFAVVQRYTCFEVIVGGPEFEAVKDKYRVDHSTRRLIYEGLYEADAMRKETTK